MDGQVVSPPGFPSLPQVEILPPLQDFAPGTQDPLQELPEQTNMQVVVSLYAPSSPQVWTLRPLHFFVPGLQLPAQPPPLQMNGHAVPDCQCPESSQLWTVKPWHCFAPGLHSPLQVPAPVQTNEQGDCRSQAPMALQSSGVALAPQRLVPGAHEPEQLPSRHTFAQAAPGTQLPFWSQVKGVRVFGASPHFLSPGLHCPLQTPAPEHTKAHGDCAIQSP
jgi:hypothetical protein